MKKTKAWCAIDSSGAFVDSTLSTDHMAVSEVKMSLWAGGSKWDANKKGFKVIEIEINRRET